MLNGKNAIIPGTRRGIGRAMVEVFAKNGANIWACARNEDKEFIEDMRKIADKYYVWIQPIYFDMSNCAEIKNGVKEIISSKKSVDILINNAGIIPENSLFSMMSFESLEKVFSVNFTSTLYLTQLVVRKMMRQKYGNIVNIASAAATDGYPSQIEYVSSKAALLGATRKLALELGEYGIRVNALAPSSADTDMVKYVNQDLMAEMIHMTALKRLAKPEEIANVAMFMASDLSSYITGQTIRVDGGLL